MKDNVMMSPSERKERTLKNRKIVTKYLRDEIFTDTEVLADLLELEQARSANKILKAMARDGLLIEHKHGRKSVWGINKDGLLFSFDEHEEIPDRFTLFRPSKFNILTFEHKKQMQLLRNHSTRSGWVNWMIPKPEKNKSCPDSIAVSPGGETIAFEFERTIKSSVRYKTILARHINAVGEGRYSRVLYLSQSEPILKRLKRMFINLIGEELKELKRENKRCSEQEVKSIFTFITLEQLSG
jgi:hypothetical protein